MFDFVRKVTVMKSCRHGEYKSFEHLLLCVCVCFFYFIFFIVVVFAKATRPDKTLQQMGHDRMLILGLKGEGGVACVC